MDRILVINPNSTEAVTQGIDEAMAALRIPGGPAIDCMTLKEGPPGIETQQHVDGVIPHLLHLVREREAEYSAFVIACYSDPGLHSVREATAKPVLGISECGILTALTLGQKFGVIAILQKSIPRHLRYMGAMGVMDRLAGELPVGLAVTELSDQKKTFGRMVEVATALRDVPGANGIVMMSQAIRRAGRLTKQFAICLLHEDIRRPARCLVAPSTQVTRGDPGRQQRGDFTFRQRWTGGQADTGIKGPSLHGHFHHTSVHDRLPYHPDLRVEWFILSQNKFSFRNRQSAER